MTRERQANRRIRLLSAIFVLAFGITFLRAAWLQGVSAARLGRMAARQHHEVQTLPAGRGAIFDRTGVQLAIGEQRTTIYADPHQVTEARRLAVAAHRILGVNPNVLYPQLLDKRRGFLYVERFAQPAAAARFLKLGFAGVGSYPEESRTYPQNTVAAQVVGYAGVDDKGLSGLEIEYDRQLAGHPGRQTIVRTPLGQAIDVINQTDPVQGRDVLTSLDHVIQAQAEQVLRSTIAQWHARSATAIVLDPRNGGILAMAQAPGYDANDANRVPQQLQRNRTVTDTYEPGSTFKLVTIAGALSDHIVTPGTQFTLPYRIRVADRTVEDAEPRPTETLTVAEILSHSSNVGAVTIAERLGAPKLMQWIKRFGFGKTTGIDFPGESAGQVLPLDRWYGSTIGNVPIGQGISVTPIQLASAYAAVANNGIWVQPHLAMRIGTRVLRHFPHHRIVSPRVDAQLKAMLTGVVDEHGGTGNAAAIPGYTVAGKTGTAQIPGKNGYSAANGYVASFVGMVPVSHPRLVVLVVVDRPQGSIFGGQVAAPAFAQIAKFDLQYLAVPPDIPETVTH